MDAVQAGAAAGRAAAPLRLLGLAAVGNVPALLLFLALAAACMALCGKALAKPYLRLLTLEPGRAKVEYRAKTQKKQPPRRALLRRELLHLGACPMWLLNCALSSLLLPVLGAAALWKAADLRAFTAAYPPESLPMLVCGMVCTIAAMNFITAPSVSLEGGTLWLLQSLPVAPQQVLRVKVELQLLLTLPGAWFCAGCAMAALRIPAGQGLLVLAVLLLGIFYPTNGAGYTAVTVPDVEDTRQAAHTFVVELPAYIHEVLSALVPIILFCAVFQLIFRRFHAMQLRKIGVGFVYTFTGLSLFLTGVNVGFMPVGHYLGQQLALSGQEWVLVPLGMLIGYFLVTAEPAVHVLNRQVESITNGGISQRAMMLSLSIGVACSVGMAMLRVLTGISIYYILVPGYLAALGLTFCVPKIFTGIAFDSGGVASGPMTTTFLLPFAMGACEALGGNVMTDAFGIVAMVAMTPLLTIQVLGLIYKKKQNSEDASDVSAEDEDSIIVLEGAEHE